MAACLSPLQEFDAGGRALRFFFKTCCSDCTVFDLTCTCFLFSADNRHLFKKLLIPPSDFWKLVTFPPPFVSLRLVGANPRWMHIMSVIQLKPCLRPCDISTCWSAPKAACEATGLHRNYTQVEVHVFVPPPQWSVIKAHLLVCFFNIL